MNGAFIDVVRRAICKLKIGYQVQENVYTWISRDPSARMHKKAFIMRNGMKETPQFKVFQRKIKSIFETGLLYSFMDTVARDGLKSSDQLSFPEGPYSKVERCLSDLKSRKSLSKYLTYQTTNKYKDKPILITEEYKSLLRPWITKDILLNLLTSVQ